MIPQNIGTPGPWKVTQGSPGEGVPQTLTRRMVGEALEAIESMGPIPSHLVADEMTPEPGKKWYFRSGSDRAIDKTLQLLKKWGLVRYRRGSGWEVVR